MEHLGHGRDNCDDCKAKGKAQSQKWHANNRESGLASTHRQVAKKKEFIREILGTACVDCGDDREEVIDWHHPPGYEPPRRKSGSRIAMTALSMPDLADELMRVIVLCASCHALRHRRVT